MGPKSTTQKKNPFCNGETDTQREGHVETEAETGATQPQAQDASRRQELEEARNDPPLEPSEEA